MLLWPHEEVPVDALAQALGIHTQNHSLWQARLHVLLVETSQAHPTCKITHVYVCQRCVCVNSICFGRLNANTTDWNWILWPPKMEKYGTVWESLVIAIGLTWVHHASPHWSQNICPESSNAARRCFRLRTASCVVAESWRTHMSENGAAPIIHWLIIHFPS